jgi:hypothetical protein
MIVLENASAFASTIVTLPYYSLPFDGRPLVHRHAHARARITVYS